MSATATLRRARPLLGTLVEIGVRAADRGGGSLAAIDRGGGSLAAIDAAFARIATLQAQLSRFVATSEIGRFNSAGRGACIELGGAARAVLDAAATLRDASAGSFDVTVGSGPWAWRCDDDGLHKLTPDVRIDLGGIAKGYAVDCAVEALVDRGVETGWVNAGGDLRAFGTLALPIDLRDETGGGVRRFATIEDGAFATSRWIDARGRAWHASVAAPHCLWADALTKIVACRGDTRDPLLARFGAEAWLHELSCRTAA